MAEQETSLQEGKTKQSAQLKTQPLIPKLRFKEFEGAEAYKKHLFSEIFKFSTGKNIKQNEASPAFEIPCVRYGELYHMYNEVITEVINRTNLNKSDLLFSKGDEILLPSAGEDPLDIGSASALTIENIAIGRTINVLRPLKENSYSQIFVSYFINEKLKKNVARLAKGVSISNVYNSDLKTLEITLPSLPEQQKIASFLSAVDEKIQHLTQKKSLLEQYKKGVMQQLFSGKLRFKDENGEDFPDWEEKRLGEVCSDITYGLTVRPAFVENGIPLLSAREISKGFIDYESAPMISHKDFNNLSKKAKPVIGDLFLSKTGSIGFSALVNQDIVSAITQNIAIIRIKNKALYSANFILQYFKTQQFLKLAIAKVNQSTIMDLQLGDIKKLPFPDMIFAEQQKIADYLSAIDTKIETVNQQIEKTQDLKKGLLQQMFV